MADSNEVIVYYATLAAEQNKEIAKLKRDVEKLNTDREYYIELCVQKEEIIRELRTTNVTRGSD